MSATTPSTRAYRSTWRAAGLWMVVLALALAALSIVLAFKQARSQTLRLMIQAEARAGDIARTARELFLQQLNASLNRVADEWQAAGGGEWHSSVPLPPWIDGLYVWDGTLLSTLVPPDEAPAGLFRALLKARLSVRPFEYEADRFTDRTHLLYDNVEERPIVMACFQSTDAANRPIVITARIHIPRLRATLVDPLLPSDDALELVPVRMARGPWAQPMTSALRFWAIQPAEAFVRDQESEALGLTVAYLGLTVLALGTLLAAMWFLFRTVRREVALAELKANFVADVSHELKTPLAVIRLYGETLHCGRVIGEEKRREYYSTITRETTRLSNLINTILDFARIEAGRREYAMQSTDVARVVRDTYETYCVQLDHAKFEHYLTIKEPLPRIDADPDAISQVLINLMNNAMKYSGDERYVAIDVTTDTRRNRVGVLILVHDRGIGVRPEDRAHLFDGFYRAADRRVRQQGGTGLGLALVKHIVDAHHGIVDVELRLVKGTTFRVFLPASEREPVSGQVPESAAEFHTGESGPQSPGDKNGSLET